MYLAKHERHRLCNGHYLKAFQHHNILICIHLGISRVVAMVTTVFNWVYKFLILGLGHCPDFDHFSYVNGEKVLVHVQFIMGMVSGGREGLRRFEQSQGLLLYCLFKAGALNIWTTRMKNKYKTCSDILPQCHLCEKTYQNSLPLFTRTHFSQLCSRHWWNMLIIMLYQHCW